jgi:hypothetical protein
MTRTICDACEEPIIENDYCDGHRDGCPNYHGYDDDDGGCDCDIHYHPECCPVCNAMEDAAEDARWREFVANELMSEEAERLGL